MGSYTRAEIVRRTGLSADTVRYYERAGLIPAVGRSAAGRRRYTDVDLKWLGLVHCLRDAGMPIAEIEQFSRLMRDGASTVDERLALLRAHEVRVRERIGRLQDHLGQIRGKIDGYASGRAWSPPPPEVEAGPAEPRRRRVGRQ
jgi:DNA-binding transcriptional MerR regulator